MSRDRHRPPGMGSYLVFWGISLLPVIWRSLLP
jgi:hypothetical protein